MPDILFSATNSAVCLMVAVKYNRDVQDTLYYMVQTE